MGTLEISTIPRSSSRIGLIAPHAMRPDDPSGQLEKVCARAAIPAIQFRRQLDSNYFCCKTSQMQGTAAGARRGHSQAAGGHVSDLQQASMAASMT
jgi:hypothetical protein